LHNFAAVSVATGFEPAIGKIAKLTKKLEAPVRFISRLLPFSRVENATQFHQVTQQSN